MTLYETVSIILEVANIAVLIFGLFFAYRQILISRRIHENNHEWHRRISTHETLYDYVVKELFPIRFQVIDIIGDENYHAKTYNDVIKNLSEDEIRKLDNLLRELLSKITLICLQVKNKVLDEDMCYLFLAHLIVSLYKFSNPFIEKYRAIVNEQHKYIDFTDLAVRWEDRMKKKSHEYRELINCHRGYKKEINTKI